MVTRTRLNITLHVQYMPVLSSLQVKPDTWLDTIWRWSDCVVKQHTKKAHGGGAGGGVGGGETEVMRIQQIKFNNFTVLTIHVLYIDFKKNLNWKDWLTAGMSCNAASSTVSACKENYAAYVLAIF